MTRSPSLGALFSSNTRDSELVQKTPEVGAASHVMYNRQDNGHINSLFFEIIPLVSVYYTALTCLQATNGDSLVGVGGYIKPIARSLPCLLLHGGAQSAARYFLISPFPTCSTTAVLL